MAGIANAISSTPGGGGTDIAERTSTFCIYNPATDVLAGTEKPRAYSSVREDFLNKENPSEGDRRGSVQETFGVRFFNADKTFQFLER